MKQIIQPKPVYLESQQLYLPQLRTKSFSTPSSKFQINPTSRYRKDSQERSSLHPKCIINLEEVDRKAHDSHAKMVSLERKKILSEYQTIDLWKEKHSGNEKLISARRHPKPDQQRSRHDENWQRALEEGMLLQSKKVEKLSSVHLKPRRKLELTKQPPTQVPNEVVVNRIHEYQRLRRDEKLERILKNGQGRPEEQLRRSNKTALPIFEKGATRFQAQDAENMKISLENPSQWEIDGDEYDQF